jgi:hypothetical protein
MKYFWLSVALVLTTALTAYHKLRPSRAKSQIKNTGVGIPDVAVVAVGSGETLSIITAQAIESGVSHNLPVEDLRKVPGVPWLSQLTVMLPSDLVVPGELTVSVTARGKTSNAATIRVQ